MLRFFRLTLGLALLVLVSTPHIIYAQQTELAKVDFSTIKIDKLTDDQIKQFVARAENTGMTMQQLEAQAISRGMPYSEVLKLRERIKSIDLENENTKDQRITDSRKTDFEFDTRLFEEEEDKDTLDKIQFFGYDLFQQKQLTFEPSLNIPTPQNYQLSAGDELLIEVWGASQSSLQLKINPEGQIIIPDLGPTRVSGLTIEKASSLIINKLSTIYSGLKGSNPNTFAQVSLGDLRSIKVTITGDVFMPGTYTLSSLATVFNALYLAGGPNIKGSFREIKVMRNATEIAVIDLYEFLLEGKTSLNIRLNDDDVIFVGTTKNRVTFTGEVHRPAIYETKDGETLSDLLNFAGGFSPKAYSRNLVVNRKTDSQRKLLNVEKDLFSSFLLSNGDSIQVGEILKRYENRVTIQGAVFREGEYALSEGLTVSELVKRAEGVREDAFTNRVAIYRLSKNLEMSVIDIDLQRILNGESKDIPLQREDLVIISSLLDLKQELTVSINGEVRKPDIYPYAQELSLGELIRNAGGLNEAASLARIDIARRVQNPTALKSDDKITEIFTFALDKNLSISDQGSSFILEPFDMVFVRPSPGYQIQALTTAEGEFMFPGSYAITRKDERISDLVARAGGLTDQAYLTGATLLREIDKAQKEQLEKIEDLESDDLIFNILVEKKNQETHQAIGINLQQILNKPKGENDLILAEGDILRVPLMLQTVRLNGELLNPVTTRFVKNTSLRNYISQAGGFSDSARKGKVFVIYANGSVDRTRNFVFFRHYPKVEPGTEIIVPKKPEKDGAFLQKTLAVSSSLSSIALITISIINQLTN